MWLAVLWAAIAWAGENGAGALDACPVDAEGRQTATALYHGTVGLFARRGFDELVRRRPTRPLMRRVLAAD